MDTSLTLLSLLLVAYASAAPSGLVAAPFAYPAPAPLVTASSHQVVARNYNGLAPVLPAAPYVAPYTLPYSAPYAAAPYALPYSAPFASPYAAAYSAPYW